jgi:hypothetical protein
MHKHSRSRIHLYGFGFVRLPVGDGAQQDDEYEQTITTILGTHARCFYHGDSLDGAQLSGLLEDFQ